MDFLEQLARSWLWLPAFFLFGISVGSFLNVYAWRYPQMMETQWAKDIVQWFEEKGWTVPSGLLQLSKSDLSLSKPRSHCPSCQQPIPFYFNIPVFGYFILKGRARCCQAPISFKYPAFELLTGLFSLWIGWSLQHTPQQAIFYLLIVWFLIAVTLIDIDSMLIPDSLLAPAVFIILTTALTFPQLFFISELKHALWGALTGFFVLYAVRLLGFLLFKKEAMGMADPKLLGIIGFLTGPAPIIIVLLIASLSALMCALIQRIGKSQPLPFGPFLCLGGFIVMQNPQMYERLLLGA